MNQSRYTLEEIAARFADPELARRFPLVLTPDQAADLLQVPKQTVYDWSSRGLLDGCAERVGKHLRIDRDHFLLLAFSGGLHAQT